LRHKETLRPAVVTIQALTEVSLLGPQAFGRPSPTSECRRRPTPGTKWPGRTISIGWIVTCGF